MELYKQYLFLLALTFGIVGIVALIILHIFGATLARIDRALDQIDNMIAGMKGCPP